MGENTKNFSGLSSEPDAENWKPQRPGHKTNLG